MKVHFEGSDSDARIEILPLMDVIFCILTFFILAALQFTSQQAININLPKAQSAQPQLKQERMIVSVDMIGQTYVDKQAVSRDQLLSALRAYIQQNPKGVVVLNAAKTASYNDVIQVLDLLRSVGGDRVALATSVSSSTEPPVSNGTAGSITNPGTINPPGWSIPGQSNPAPAGQNNLPPTGVAPILPAIPGLPSNSTPGAAAAPPAPPQQAPAPAR